MNAFDLAETTLIEVSRLQRESLEKIIWRPRFVRLTYRTMTGMVQAPKQTKGPPT